MEKGCYKTYLKLLKLYSTSINYKKKTVAQNTASISALIVFPESDNFL